jgi:hypothetical protein
MFRQKDVPSIATVHHALRDVTLVVGLAVISGVLFLWAVVAYFFSGAVLV